MTLPANAVQICDRKRETVGIVTIGAGNPFVIHPALYERTVFIILFLNLSIREINTLLQKARQITIQQRFACPMIVFDRPSSGVAGGARFEFGAATWLTFPASGSARGWILLPAAVNAFQRNNETFGVVWFRIGFLSL